MPHAVVTGSSGGIGSAVVARLLAQGWTVEGWDRVAPKAAHASFRPEIVDLADPEASTAIAKRCGRVDALVHAAGFMRVGRLGELDHAATHGMWRLHVDALMRIADVLVPAMARAGGGRVVLLGSRAAQGAAGRSQYAALKAALVGIARSWALEWVGQGVMVNVVSPAATATPMLFDPDRASEPPKTPPFGRFITADEIAGTIAFLLSADAAPITGQEIVVCGGASLAR